MSAAPNLARFDRTSREVFIARERAQRVGFAAVADHPQGFTANGRPYVALACRCGDRDHCPGWAMVHDDPADRDHFNQLFGEAARHAA